MFSFEIQGEFDKYHFWGDILMDLGTLGTVKMLILLNLNLTSAWCSIAKHKFQFKVFI